MVGEEILYQAVRRLYENKDKSFFNDLEYNEMF